MSPKLRKLSGKEIVAILSKLGTLRAIIRQAGRFIPEEHLRREFYSE